MTITHYDGYRLEYGNVINYEGEPSVKITELLPTPDNRLIDGFSFVISQRALLNIAKHMENRGGW